MANHYTTLSVALDWPPEAVATLVEADRLLSTLVSDETIEDDAADPELVAHIREVYETSQGGAGCIMVLHGPGAVVHSDESADVSALAELVGFAMRRHAIAEPVVIEWAETCSKPRPGEFGGGAVIVTASETRWMTTGEWARGVIAEMASAAPHPVADEKAESRGETMEFEGIPCSNSAEFGPAPAGASFVIDRTAAERIVSIASALPGLGAWKAEAFDWSCFWTAPEGDPFADESGEMLTEADALCVSTTHFWFEAIPKHAGGYVSCQELSVAELAEHFGLDFPRKPSAASPAARLAVVIEGGLVQEIVSDDPRRIDVETVIVIDLDVEGADPDELALIPRLDGILAEGFSHRHGKIAVSPYDLAALDASLDREDEEDPDVRTES